ncbi:hypothetical protein DSL72_007973 [Monilinia vaccinii-corymbosi]|uniref:Uncharacterized protein n=1 Tax=Monilinia vaccinii-corymbosi TaxID=61207 RepID=A0A8A3PJB2_9HELO|nr:hypothetical protein DSL72_007973 [Monilinia vaccinii-corymbosi]
MMVVSHSPLKLVGLSPGAANGVQTIVNLQFRKEHCALLDLFGDLKTKVEKSSADAERRVEESQKQLEETENRLKKLEDEYRDLAQKNKAWEDELKDLKRKMKKLGELMRAGTCATGLQRPQLPRINVSSHGLLHDKDQQQQSQLPLLTASPDHYRRDVADLQDHLKLNIISSQVGLDMPAVRQQPSKPIAEEPSPVLRSDSTLLSSVSNTTLQNRHNHPLDRHESNQAMPSTAHNKQAVLPPPSPLSAPRAIERRPPLSGKPSRKATSRKFDSLPPWVNISQAPDQDNETYLTYAAEYIGGIKQRKDQFEFIARFIRGLLDEEDRDTLLRQLQKKFSSRTTKNGLVEVMCGFADVGDAMEAVGLLGRSRSGKRDGDDAGMSSVQKKRKALESQLSEEYDDEL